MYFRPEWTCGRYNPQHRVAIFYNLLEGMAYLFEDESADVVDSIITTKRNKPVNFDNVQSLLDIPNDELEEFCDQLAQVGLLTKYTPNSETISEYRGRLREYRKSNALRENLKLQTSSVLINDDDVEMKYMERCGVLFSVMFEMTYNCSEKCLHCYNPGATRNEGEYSNRSVANPLSFEEYKRLIDELYNLGVVKVCLSGGDPFSNSLTWQVIDYLWEKNIVFDIFTNGQLIVGKEKRLADYYPRTIGVSLYSDVPAVHDSITRVSGSHSLTKRFLRACSDLAIPTLIKCCIMKPNVKSYPTIKAVAEEFGMIPQFDINITDSIDGDLCASKYLRLNTYEMEVVLRDVDLPYYINGIKKLEIKEKPHRNGYLCNAGISSICITPDGSIQPCCAFPMKCGNIRKDSIESALQSPQLLNWKEYGNLSNSECLSHPYCVFCQLCAGNNYNSTGDYLRPSENNCFIAKTRYNLSLKMQDGYDPIEEYGLIGSLERLNVSIQPLHREYKEKR